MIQMSFAVLSCVLWLSAPALLHPEFKVAYVTDHNVYMCADLVLCERMNFSEKMTFSNCRGQTYKPESPVKKKRLTVWYTSPLKVALLLNNSEVQHLSLIQCKPTVEQDVPFEYFTVQRLEMLTVQYPFLRSELSYVIGKDRDALYHEEARVAVIHTSVLTGKTQLKSYTVQTQADHNGVMSFPEMFMSRSGLAETSSIFVTFLY